MLHIKSRVWTPPRPPPSFHKSQVIFSVLVSIPSHSILPTHLPKGRRQGPPKTPRKRQHDPPALEAIPYGTPCPKSKTTYHLAFCLTRGIASQWPTVFNKGLPILMVLHRHGEGERGDRTLCMSCSSLQQQCRCHG